ncbi:MAG: DUF262 domain-containing protein [Candidatus Lokiarchaeota archaeon]|nr:DUF262 domain-containing protein [Candidatus Lokiarchaeota archaeon]
MNTTSTNKKIRDLIVDIRNNKLIPAPYFQRRLVWTNKNKSALIKTILDGYPFPEIFIASGDINLETGEGYSLLVDGQQRITTINQYFLNSPELKLTNGVPPYENLTVEQKEAFLQYIVVVRDLGHPSDEEIIEVFTRINSTNYSLNAMEIQNARYDGAIKNFAEIISQSKFFDTKRIFSAADIRRMNDLKFTLTLIITIISTYFHRDNELENYLAMYNDDFPYENLTEELSFTFNFVDKCHFPERCRCWNKADLFTLIVELHRVLFKDKISLSQDMVSNKLQEFYKKVDEIDTDQPKEDERIFHEYLKASQQATNDRSNRIKRGYTINELLVSCQES